MGDSIGPVGVQFNADISQFKHVAEELMRLMHRVQGEAEKTGRTTSASLTPSTKPGHDLIGLLSGAGQPAKGAAAAAARSATGDLLKAIQQEQRRVDAGTTKLLASLAADPRREDPAAAAREKSERGRVERETAASRSFWARLDRTPSFSEIAAQMEADLYRPHPRSYAIPPSDYLQMEREAASRRYRAADESAKRRDRVTAQRIKEDDRRQRKQEAREAREQKTQRRRESRAQLDADRMRTRMEAHVERVRKRREAETRRSERRREQIESRNKRIAEDRFVRRQIARQRGAMNKGLLANQVPQFANQRMQIGTQAAYAAQDMGSLAAMGAPLSQILMSAANNIQMMGMATGNRYLMALATTASITIPLAVRAWEKGYFGGEDLVAKRERDEKQQDARRKREVAVQREVRTRMARRGRDYDIEQIEDPLEALDEALAKKMKAQDEVEINVREADRDRLRMRRLEQEVLAAGLKHDIAFKGDNGLFGIPGLMQADDIKGRESIAHMLKTGDDKGIEKLLRNIGEEKLAERFVEQTGDIRARGEVLNEEREERTKVRDDARRDVKLLNERAHKQAMDHFRNMGKGLWDDMLEGGQAIIEEGRIFKEERQKRFKEWRPGFERSAKADTLRGRALDIFGVRVGLQDQFDEIDERIKTSGLPAAEQSRLRKQFESQAIEAANAQLGQTDAKGRMSGAIMKGTEADYSFRMRSELELNKTSEEAVKVQKQILEQVIKMGSNVGQQGGALKVVEFAGG